MSRLCVFYLRAKYFNCMFLCFFNLVYAFAFYFASCSFATSNVTWKFMSTLFFVPGKRCHAAVVHLAPVHKFPL